MEYGIQMYGLRDITGTQMERALREVAQMGYSHVEFAGFFGIPADEIKRMLDAYGLRASGTHTGWQQPAEHFAETVKYHHDIGCSELIIPGADVSTREKLDAFIDIANDLKPRLAAEGIQLHYHNHSFEFLPNSDGQIAHTELENRTDLLFEIDTYWAFNAKIDPIALLDRLAGRIRVIHVKDGDTEGHGKTLGNGCAPVFDVMKKAVEKGFATVVESETMQPDGISEAKCCIEYLKSLSSRL